MSKKTITLLILMLLSTGCLSVVFADNTTAESEDMSNYIHPVSITDNGIEFSDGFTGFALDDSKSDIESDDGFTQSPAGSSELENYVKLTIIECYRQGKENDIGQIVAKFVDGTYENSNDEIIKEVLNSDETINGETTETIDDATEATFSFELLKSANGNKSDCLAYSVSLKKVSHEKLTASNSDESANATGDEEAVNETDDNNSQKENDTDGENTETQDKHETIINETNKTIINKTNTNIVNVNNTTITNQKNVKIINKTNETPKNDTIENTLLKAAGNPIFILIVVIAIAAIATIVLRRKD